MRRYEKVDVLREKACSACWRVHVSGWNVGKCAFFQNSPAFWGLTKADASAAAMDSPPAVPHPTHRARETGHRAPEDSGGDGGDGVMKMKMMMIVMAVVMAVMLVVNMMVVTTTTKTMMMMMIMMMI